MVEKSLKTKSHIVIFKSVHRKLCETLPKHMGHKVFFDNWFTTLDLMLLLKKKGYLAGDTIRNNRVQGCPVIANKDIAKKIRGSSDHRVDNNSSTIIVKWKDNNILQLTSNFVGIESVDSIQRWDRTENSKKICHAPELSKHTARVWGE